MTFEEVCRRFKIDRARLLHYEANGLFDCRRQQDGRIDYCDEILEYIGLIDLLLQAGLDMPAVRQYLAGAGSDGHIREEQIKILIRQRYKLLEDIHDKETLLRHLDFLIRENQKKVQEVKE